MMFGPAFSEDGVLFRLWAPLHESVSLRIEGADRRPMQADDDGWHRCMVAGAGAGTRYRFLLPDGLESSRSGPRASSRRMCTARAKWSIFYDYRWKTNAWTGRPWEKWSSTNCISAASQREGNFSGAAIERLDHLRGTGA